ncbi:NAD(P)-dependent oxidoreductase [Pseudomonas sp. R1-7]|uniref:NAD(P)-dependent oxidoreductase n=1 Tax=Pseudomonas sp. R1-7 TaxID=2817398 RepID=UPI003DA838BC
MINIKPYREMSLNDKRIGLIGLGRMGMGVAISLIRDRQPLVSYANNSRRGMSELLALGGTEVASPAGIARLCNVIILSLPSTDEVEEVCFGEEGISSVICDGLLVIDTTTGHPLRTKKIAERLAQKNIRYVDAPLTRGPAEARRGELNAILGSPDLLLADTCRVLSRFCSYVLHVGDVGEGQKIKLLNNALSMGVVALAADMVGAARSLDVAPNHLKLLIERGGVNNSLTQAFLKFAIERGEDPLQFTIRSASKDLDYCFDILDVPGDYQMIAAARAVYLSNVLRGRGNKTLGGLLDD